jgi:predicted MPP superfamily phosphohydrolase
MEPGAGISDMGRRLGLAALAALAAPVAWGWFEAGWVRLRVLRCPVAGLPPELEGLRIAHLSDFHLGFPSRGTGAVRRAVDWVVERQPDLVVLTGDLLSRPSGERLLRELLQQLGGGYAVWGNHDFAQSRDPFSRRVHVEDLRPLRLLENASETTELRGVHVQVAGVEPMSYLHRQARPAELADPEAPFRILLCHFPSVIDALPPRAFHLVLAGHMHAGQIVIPTPWRKIRLAHLRWRYAEGLYRRPAGTLHVSPGLGTTFVPFRFFARPEATELVLEPA